MFFRNLFLFRFGAGIVPDEEALVAAMQDHRLREPGPNELATLGWVSPLGRGSEALTLASSIRYVLIALGGSERILPSQVVAEELADRIERISQKEGRRVSGRERKRIKEEVIAELLPRAFVRSRQTHAYLDLQDGWLVVDTATRRVAEAVVSQLRESLGRFPCVPMSPEESPRALMTDWLVRAALPHELLLGDEVELRDPAEAGAVVRCTRQDLETDEVREHLASGKQAFRLGMEFDKRLSFVLGEDLSVRKLRFLDDVLDQLDSGSFDSTADEVFGTFALQTLELARLLARMAELFGLSAQPALKLDGGDAPKHMRRAQNAAPIRAAAGLADLAKGDGASVTISGGGHSITITGADGPRLRKHAERLAQMEREDASPKRRSSSARMYRASKPLVPLADSEDELYRLAVDDVRANDNAAVQRLQNLLGIGFNATMRIVDRMQAEGVISAPDSNGSRRVLP